MSIDGRKTAEEEKLEREAEERWWKARQHESDVHWLANEILPHVVGAIGGTKMTTRDICADAFTAAEAFVTMAEERWAKLNKEGV